MHDIVVGVGRAWRLMTVDEAHHLLSVPRSEYGEILATIPQSWKSAIAAGPDRRLNVGDVFTTAVGKVASRVLSLPDRQSTGEAEELLWQGATARLSPTGAVRPLTSGLLPEGFLRVNVRYRGVTRDEERLERLETDPLAHDAAVLRDAIDLQTEALALPGHSGGEDSYMIGLVRPCTGHQARLVAIGDAKASSLANVAAAQVWEPIRTLDAREARAHFYPWVAPMRPKVQREIIARWVEQISTDWLPGRALDVYQRRLHSGFPAGPGKRKDGWEFCARCRQSLGLSQCTAAQHEGVIHMCESCPSTDGPAEVLAVLYSGWERLTGEKLRHTGPLAMFGDRRYGRDEADAEQKKHLEEPWRAAHAAVAIALDCARRHASPTGAGKGPLDESKLPKAWPLARVLAKARTEFCRISCTRAQSQRKASEFAEFHRLWVRSGILSPTARHETRQQYRTDLFTVDRPDVASPQATSVLCFATDGSGAKDGKAGWGSSAQRLQPGDEDSARGGIGRRFRVPLALRALACWRLRSPCWSWVPTRPKSCLWQAGSQQGLELLPLAPQGQMLR